MCRAGGPRCDTPAERKAHRAALAREAYAARKAAQGGSVRPYIKRTTVTETPNFAPTSPLNAPETLQGLRDKVAHLDSLTGEERAIRARQVERDCRIVGDAIENEAIRLSGVNPGALVERNQALIADMRDLEASGQLSAALTQAKIAEERAPGRAAEARAKVRDMLTTPLVDHGYLDSETAKRLTVDQARTRVQAAILGNDRDTRDQLQKLQAARTRVLSSIRPMGGHLQVHGGDEAQQKAAQSLARHLPADWVEDINARGGVTLTEGRTANEAVAHAALNSTVRGELRDAHWASRGAEGRPQGAEAFFPWSRSAAAAAAGVGAHGRVPDPQWTGSTLGILATT